MATSATGTSNTDSLMQSAAEDIAKQNQVQPLTNDFDETKSAASRTNDIIASDSPLMQLAATRGTQMAAQRGLTNSSLAAGSAQDSVIAAAAPIAQTDASLSSQTNINNTNVKNNAAIANANNATALSSTGMQLDNSNQQQTKNLAQQQQQFDVQSKQAQQQIDAQIDQFAKSLGMTAQDLQIKRDTLTQQQQQFYDNLTNQKAIAGLQADTQVKVAQLENQFKADIANQGNITNAWGTMMTTINNIQNNSALDPNTKTTLINNQLASFQAYADFWKQTSNVDVGPLLNFGAAGAPAPAPGQPGLQPVPNAPAPSWSPYTPGSNPNQVPVWGQN